MVGGEDIDGNPSTDFSALKAQAASVLIVDDHPPNLVALEAVLSPLGYRVVAVTSGKQALAELLGEDFAVILLDVKMPVMDGFETASLIKSHKRMASIPLIFMTAFDRDAEHIFTGYARGGVDYLVKPVDPDIVRSKVAVFVELHLRGQTIRSQQAVIRQQQLDRLEALHERRFRTALEAMPLPVWGANADGTIAFTSRVWSEYSGRGARAPLIEADTVHPEHLRSLQHHWATMVEQKVPFTVECQLRHREGSYRWHLCRAVAEYGQTGDVEGWVVTATDIDDHKRQAAERARLLALEREARAEAEKLNAAKDTFLAIVSHELRTPLNAIVGWSQLLSAGKVQPDRIPAALQTIQRNALAQARLVNDLLDLSRVVFGKLQLWLEWTPVGVIVRAAVEALRPTAEAKRITLTCSAECDDLVFADAARLQQVVANLLVNALKFTRSGGRVDVRLTRTVATFDIAVSDNGKGILASALPHVFDRFRQVDLQNLGPVAGLGLGLAVVDQIVQLHGGKVVAESPGEGAGATFTVSLPVSPSPAQLASAGPPPSAPVPDEAMTLEGQTVLIVEDEDDARTLLAESLQNRGATVVSVHSARAALEFLGGARPDAVISDIGMPDRDGYSLICSIRERETKSGHPRLPAIALTAYAYPNDGQRAVSEGFDAHLAKPYNPIELVDVLCALLHRRGGPRSNRAEPRGAEPEGGS
jgi:PAS domain S-box-containing protein